MTLLPAFNERMLWTFPCGEDKKPRNKRGFKDAVQGATWPSFPLVGAPTGEKNGFDVLDIDGAEGLKWYDKNYDAIPQTRAHSTQRGMHLFFRNAPGLDCSTSRIAPRIDVRAEGGYCIWWPREGYPVQNAPIAEWPDWLFEEAREKHRPGRTRDQSKVKSFHDVVVVRNRTDALRKLDPCEWRGEHDLWFRLLMGCKAAGIECEDFVEWSIGDPDYANDADIIRVKWHSVEPIHAGAFFAALRDHGIRVHTHSEDCFALVSHTAPATAPAKFKPKSSFSPRSRLTGIQWKLDREGREPLLFWSACEVAEMVAEGWPARKVGEHLLEQSCKANGLWRLLGPKGCKQRIENGFRHVEEKLKEKA